MLNKIKEQEGMKRKQSAGHFIQYVLYLFLELIIVVILLHSRLKITQMMLTLQCFWAHSACAQATSFSHTSWLPTHMNKDKIKESDGSSAFQAIFRNLAIKRLNLWGL